MSVNQRSPCKSPSPPEPTQTVHNHHLVILDNLVIDYRLDELFEGSMVLRHMPVNNRVVVCLDIQFVSFLEFVLEFVHCHLERLNQTDEDIHFIF